MPADIKRLTRLCNLLGYGKDLQYKNITEGSTVMFYKGNSNIWFISITTDFGRISDVELNNLYSSICTEQFLKLKESCRHNLIDVEEAIKLFDKRGRRLPK